MGKLFYIGLFGLMVFEILNVYFIMPMPGSQKMDSLDFAYFLYTWRWVLRFVFATAIISGALAVWRKKRKWIPITLCLIAGAVIYFVNFRMSADRMFLKVEQLIFKTEKENEVDGDRLVVGVENNGEAKAYPIQFLLYHHQIQDTIGGLPIIATYCSVCRSGRVYEPKVNGKHDRFRLVGMDHFNAMFEDESTGSWWRQSTGKAVKGELEGEVLPEVLSVQMTVDKWFEMYPNGLLMQADPVFASAYDSLARFEQGQNKGGLTGTDKESWNAKSWIVGIEIDNLSKAYDWNDLIQERIINDKIGETPIVLVLASDGQSFAAYERPSEMEFKLTDGDVLISGKNSYNFFGENLTASERLKSVGAYQEFWHSWQTFHPMSEKY
ncbi:DUF3179 domain-containing protein [Crocinitomix catalasitica]|nr:DUF3179 domain-containing protein [Crocinitomix catalasitica]